ncbi:MAG: hypothetical protein CSB47_00235 [Proteobacteria bacterium]|nr:MAG: hypothetical protein CSB47_00235 [Pseudomonadota bacterium]
MSVLNRLMQVTSTSVVALCISTAMITQATAAERFVVSGVESWDTLNVRAQPSARSTIIGEIPANGKNVISTGQEARNGRTRWVKVNWNGVSGWVSKRYLAATYVTQKPVVPAAPTNYIKAPDYSMQGSGNHTGDIFDAGTGTVRSVYVGPDSGLPKIKPKQRHHRPVQPRRMNKVNTANTHTHPANQCTRSVSHTHPNGIKPHTHRYSCKGQATQQRPQAKRRVNTVNTHTHPRNQFTNAVTHTHANGNVPHRHNYGTRRQVVKKQQRQVAPSVQQVTHIHPASPYNKQIKHTHPGGASVHIHDFLMPPQYNKQRAAQVQRKQVSASTHTHPKNALTNSITHTHPNGANPHTHNYGGQR